MDEAGISSREPIVLVVAIIVDADRRWKRLESRIHEIAAERGIDPEQIVFHAKDLFHGTGLFPRDKWPLKERLDILRKLVSIPHQFNIPFAYGFFRRGQITVPPHAPDVEARKAQHTAFVSCVLAAEQYMRAEALPREVATIIAEDNPQVRTALKSSYKRLKDRESDFLLMPSINDLLPIQRIVDTIHFSAKDESPLLQIVDACAFVLARHLSGGSHIAPLYDALTDGTNFVAPDGCWGASADRLEFKTLKARPMSLAEAVQMPLLAMLKQLRCRTRVARPPTETAKGKAPDVLGPGSSGALDGDHSQVES
jgi:hypothetical protein